MAVVRLVFAGTPEPAVASLQALLDAGFDVAAVLTRPPARSGRGRTLSPSPVAEFAAAHGIETLTPSTLTDETVINRLRELAPDCMPVVAYGVLVPAALLDLPPLGWINLHFSLLPAWRGAAPVQHAILRGDEITGATTFRIDAGLDTGPVLGRLTEAIGSRDTSGSLLDRLAQGGANLLVATIAGLASGQLVAEPQPSDGVSLAPKITVEDALVRWADPAYAVDRRVRATTPDPGAWTRFRGERLGLGPVEPAATPGVLTPGEVLVSRHDVIVGTGSGAVRLGTVRPAGKREMPAADWARGVRPQPGERVG